VAEPTPNRRNGDPTTNVFELVAAESRHQSEMRVAADRRQDDLRTKQEYCDNEIATIRIEAQKELGALESKMRDAQALAEQRRLDALLAANTSNVALALEKQGAQAQAQDRRIAVLEQNQYQSGGKDLQRTEQRTQGNFNLSQWISVGGILLIVAIDLHRNGVI
jgi:hypothetical protein